MTESQSLVERLAGEAGDQSLTKDDVYTLIGHAEFMRMEGKADMPNYFYGLAARIALHIGDDGLLAHCAAIRQRFGVGE